MSKNIKKMISSVLFATIALVPQTFASEIITFNDQALKAAILAEVDENGDCFLSSHTTSEY